MKIFRTVSFLLWVLAFGFLAPTYGEDWRNLVQPKGTLVIVETAATVNARLGGNPPFETTTDVTTINTSGSPPCSLGAQRIAAPTCGWRGCLHCPWK